MHQELQVVEGKLLHVLPQLVLLIHALDEEEGLLAYLRGGVATCHWRGDRGVPWGTKPRAHTLSFSWELRSSRTWRYWNCRDGRLKMRSRSVDMPR